MCRTVWLDSEVIILLLCPLLQTVQTVRLTPAEWSTPTRPSAPWSRPGSQITSFCSLVRWIVGTEILVLHLLLPATWSWRPLQRSALPSSAATSIGQRDDLNYLINSLDLLTQTLMVPFIILVSASGLNCWNGGPSLSSLASLGWLQVSGIMTGPSFLWRLFRSPRFHKSSRYEKL